MVKETPRILSSRIGRKRRLEKLSRDINKQPFLSKSQSNLPNPSSSSSSPVLLNLLSPEPTSKPPPTVDSLSGYRSFSDQVSPECQRAFPPLPPLAPSPQFLPRAISDHAHLMGPFSDSTGLMRVSKNSGNAHQVFDEMSYQNVHRSASRVDDMRAKRKNRGRAITVEKKEGDWTMIIISCPCGSEYQLLISEVEKKCYHKRL